MHGAQQIRRSNSQKPLNLTGLQPGQTATLTPLGEQVGVFTQLPIQKVDDDSVTIGGHEFKAYNGSLVFFEGRAHTLDLPQAEPAVA